MDYKEPEDDMLDELLEKCRENNLSVISGDLVRGEPGKVPVLLQLEEPIYNRLMSVASNNNLDLEKMLEVFVSDLLGEPGDDEEEGDLEKLAEELGEEGPSEDVEDWSMGSELPPPTDVADFNESHYGSETEEDNALVGHKKKIARYVSTPINDLEDILEDVFEKSIGYVSISLSMSAPDKLHLNIRYPEDGIDSNYTIDYADSSLNRAFKEAVDKIDKWEDIAFGPKLEGGTEVTANLNAKVIAFNKTTGRYKVKITDKITVEVSPEDLDDLK